MATRTVDLGSVIGPRGPQGPKGDKGDTGPQGATGPRGPAVSGTAFFRTARFVVGTSQAGWTLNDCDFLCDGTDDQVEINAAIAALPAGGGEIVLLDGEYSIGFSNRTTDYIAVNKPNVTLRGSGPSTRLLCDRLLDTVVVTADGCTIRDMYIFSDKFCAIRCSGNYLTVLNTDLECPDSGEFALSVSGGTGCLVMGNRCTGANGVIYISAGSGHVVMGNRVSHAVGTGSATNCVVANNLTAPWSEG